MRIKIELPDRLKNHTFQFHAEELEPSAIVALIDMLTSENPNDERIPLLKALWEELT